jgi:predicted Zn-dependent protease
VASGPANAEARNNLGAILLAINEASASIPQLLEAIRLRPVYAEAHYNLARAYASAGRFAEAVTEAALAEAQAAAAGKSALTVLIRDDLQRYRASVKP